MATAASSFHDALESLLQALFPSTCACCGEVLVQGERQICLQCSSLLPHTHLGAVRDNYVERLLGGRIKLQQATSMLQFHHGGIVQRLIHAMKYHRGCDLCIEMGRLMGLDLLRSARFDDVDLLVPVPLHWTRRLQRGYNQSELLCRGIAQTFGRQVNTTALVRHRYTRKQSRTSADKREANVSGAFSLRRPQELEGHHLLLVDDVLTTGATLASCCQPLASIPGIRISCATLCLASTP